MTEADVSEMVQNNTNPESLFLAILKAPKVALLLPSLKELKPSYPHLFNPIDLFSPEYSKNLEILDQVGSSAVSELLDLFGINSENYKNSRVSKLWIDGDQEKAIKLSKKYKLQVNHKQKYIEDRHGVISFLLGKEKFQLVKDFIKKTEFSAKPIVEVLISFKKLREALLIAQGNLDLTEYPQLMELSISNRIYALSKINSSVEYVLSIEERIYSDQHMAYYISGLSAKKNPNWKKERAAHLFRKYPNTSRYLSRGLVSFLNGVRSKTYRGLPDEFGPLHPEFQLVLDIPASEVFFINSPAQVQLLQWTENVIGLDCEYTGRIHDMKDHVSLIQIALRNRVFIVDLLALDNCQALDEKLCEMFFDKKIIKLGVSFDGDMKVLKKSHPNMKFTEKIESCVDLVHLYKKFFRSFPGGLAGLCSNLLGKPLSKAEQCTSFARRPLRQSQIHYAALDAHVEIKIWDCIVERFWTHGTSVEEFIDTSAKVEVDHEIKKACKECCKFHEEGQCVLGEKCKICFRFFHTPENCIY